MNTNPHVVILLASFNGAANLRAQLDSIAEQTYENWSLLISDDGSTDTTVDVIETFADEGHPVQVLTGPGDGAGANFMSLVRRFQDVAPPDSWLAFCDQDDVWLPDRLARGIAGIQTKEPNLPSLFCSRTWITNENLEGRRLSAPRPRPMSFRNALVQNVASGNTILLNASAAQLVSDAANECSNVVIHDWWAYQIVAGAGGALIHDDAPTLLYRQHEVNQIGANDNTGAKLKRMAMLLSGKFASWNETNIAALKASSHRLTEENLNLLSEFAQMRRANRLHSLLSLHRLKLYRQTSASTAALWLAVLIRRI